MVSRDDDTARLVQALARLLARVPPPRMLRGREPAVALACRGAVVVALRQAAAQAETTANTSRVVGPSAARATLITGLRAALDAVPLSTATPLPLPRALAAPPTPRTAAWRDAAVAAATLERHPGWLPAAGLPAAARTLAHLCAALPVLDADLAAALPAQPGHPHSALSGPRHHLRAAARDLARHLAAHGPPAGSPGVQVDLRGALPSRPHARPVSGLPDVPNATRHLAGLLERRGPDLTLAEVRAAVRVLSAGHTLAARVLPGVAVEQLAPTGPLYRGLRGGVATLGEPDLPVLILAGDIHRHLTQPPAHPRHPAPPRAPTAPTGKQPTRGAPPEVGNHPERQLQDTLVDWLPAAAALAGVIEHGLGRAAAAGNLYTVADERPPASPTTLLWRPARPAEDLPLLAAARAASAAADTVARSSGRPPPAPALTLALARLHDALALRQHPASQPEQAHPAAATPAGRGRGR